MTGRSANRESLIIIALMRTYAGTRQIPRRPERPRSPAGCRSSATSASSSSSTCATAAASCRSSSIARRAPARRCSRARKSCAPSSSCRIDGEVVASARETTKNPKMPTGDVEVVAHVDRASQPRRHAALPDRRRGRCRGRPAPQVSLPRPAPAGADAQPRCCATSVALRRSRLHAPRRASSRSRRRS